jgi:ketosteroid isomerase-like protein
MAGGRQQFRAVMQDVSEAYRWLTALPIPPLDAQAQLARLHDELAVRQHLCSYTDAFDSKDLDRIVDHFEEDAVLVTNRGTFPNREGIRNYYEPATRLNRLSYHRVQDFCIRVTEPGTEAWMAAYFHAPFIAGEIEARSQYGRYFGRLTKPAGRWRFADWRISVDENRLYPKTL